jgi:hypothetical protein
MKDRETNIQASDDGQLIVVGSTPRSSPDTSPCSSRPASAKVRNIKPLSAGEKPIVLHDSHASLGDRQHQRRLEVHRKRKERSLHNIFSDPIIEKELGRSAEVALKEDRASAFRQHVQKVGGRFSRFSFKRNVFIPEHAAAVMNNAPLPRPSFAPVNSHSNIIGIQPESSQHDAAGPEVIEPPSLVPVAARPGDIKNMSLHHGVRGKAGKTPSIRIANVSEQRPSSAVSHISSLEAHENGVQLLSSPSMCKLGRRPLSADAHPLSYLDCTNPASCLTLTGEGLCGRLIEMSGQGKIPRSAYVTAGAVPLHVSVLNVSSFTFGFFQCATVYFKRVLHFLSKLVKK